MGQSTEWTVLNKREHGWRDSLMLKRAFPRGLMTQVKIPVAMSMGNGDRRVSGSFSRQLVGLHSVVAEERMEGKKQPLKSSLDPYVHVTSLTCLSSHTQHTSIHTSAHTIHSKGGGEEEMFEKC